MTQASDNWYYIEAQRVADHLVKKGKNHALFETGYGPSGLPHIGTFGEVARTAWVRNAFTDLTGKTSSLIAFSDDMDGFRKIPDNVPNHEMLKEFLGQPLSMVPDPFGTHESFAAHNNAKLREFLDQFGFDYQFESSTDHYRSGSFNDALLKVLDDHQQIVDIIAPTLGAERRSTYSPFLPIHPRTNEVMQVAIDQIDLVHHTILWTDRNGTKFETDILNGGTKLQWKADWAMRWYAFGVDYEMSGKDLIDSVKLSTAIARQLGAEPPVTVSYELFLDKEGKKISKSKGNGLSVEEWLKYAPTESLAQFMFPNPQRAKKLFFEIIPRTTDEYIASAKALKTTDDPKNNSAHHIKQVMKTGSDESPIGFAMLLNLASVINADNSNMLWEYIQTYVPGANPDDSPFLAGLVEHAVLYYQDIVKPTKQYRAPTEKEIIALRYLAVRLVGLPRDSTAETIQEIVYAVGKHYEFTPLKAWFDCLYQVLLGQNEGPRFGAFVVIYGIDNTLELISSKLPEIPKEELDAFYQKVTRDLLESFNK